MEQCGVIISLNAGNAIVSVKRDTACGKCKACPADGQNEVFITVPNNIDAHPGDRVVITMEPSKILRAAVIVYLLPLVGLVVGVLAGIGLAPQFNLDSELSGVAGGISLTLLTFLGIRAIEPCIRKNGCFEPRIVYRIEKFTEGEDKNGI